MSDENVDENGPVGIYEGETLNGLRHGKGTYIFPSGARYIGTWDRGLKHGVGTFIYPDGSRYEGQWWQNHKHGYGRYTYPNEDTYDGMWSLDERHGFGLYYDDDKKFHFKGNFRHGILDGPTLVVNTNVSFTGKFENGMPIGKGTYYLPNGLSVEGEFKLYGEKTPLWTTTNIRRSFNYQEE